MVIEIVDEELFCHDCKRAANTECVEEEHETEMKGQEARDLVAEARKLLGSGAVQLPLRVDGWHISLTGGGWFIKNASDHAFMTIDFVPAEKESGKPALDGNAPARAVVALLNAVPALCDEVDRLRKQWNTRISTFCGNCGKRYLGPENDHLHGYGICNVPSLNG